MFQCPRTISLKKLSTHIVFHSLMPMRLAGWWKSEGPRGVPPQLESCVWLDRVSSNTQLKSALDSSKRGKHEKISCCDDSIKGSKCEWCGKTDAQAKDRYKGQGLSTAHCVVHSAHAFNRRSDGKYFKECVQLSSKRNFWRLCGTEAQEGSCHWAQEHKHAACVYNPFDKKGWCLLSFSDRWHGHHLDRQPPQALIPGHMPYRRVAAAHAKLAVTEAWSKTRSDTELQRQLDVLEESSGVTVDGSATENRSTMAFETEQHSRQQERCQTLPPRAIPSHAPPQTQLRQAFPKFQTAWLCTWCGAAHPPFHTFCRCCRNR